MGKASKLQFDSFIFLYGLAALCLSVFIIFAPFNRALFYSSNYLFEKPIFAWTLLLSITFLITATIICLKRNSLRTSELCLYFSVLLIPLSMAASHLSAVSQYSSIQSIILGITFALLFISSHTLMKHKPFSDFLKTVLLGSGYIVVTFGILNLAGIFHYPDAIAVSRSANGTEIRLNSVFQYSNAYASYLVALFLTTLLLLVQAKKPFHASLYSFVLFPIMLSLLLTGSKGGLIILAAGLLALLYFLNPIQQLSVFGLFALSLLPSLALTDHISQIGILINTNNNLKLIMEALIPIAGVSLFVSCSTYIIKIIANRSTSNRIHTWSRAGSARSLFLTLIIIMVAGAGLFYITHTYFPEAIPESIKNRISNLSSISERFMYYKDTMPLILDHLIIGVGGGGWGNAIVLYQKYPFQTSQAHSFVFQQIAEYGLVGFACMFLFIAYILITFIRKTRNSDKLDEVPPNTFYFMICFPILLHSMFDFTMSFAYIACIFFISLGGVAMSASESDSRLYIWRPRSAFITFITVSFVLTIFSALQSWNIVNNNDSFKLIQRMKEQNSNLSQISMMYGRLMSKTNINPYFELFHVTLLLQLYSQTKNDAYMDSALTKLGTLLQKEPYNREVWNQQYIAALNRSDLEAAFINERQALDIFPWDIQLYEHLITVSYRLGFEQRAQGTDPRSITWWDETINYYKQATHKNLDLKSFTNSEQINQFNFRITDIMSLNAGIALYMRGDYEAAEGALKSNITYTPQTETQKGIDRWYLAALQKQNKNDLQLYEQLIQSSSNEKDNIKQLLNGQY